MYLGFNTSQDLICFSLNLNAHGKEMIRKRPRTHTRPITPSCISRVYHPESAGGSSTIYTVVKLPHLLSLKCVGCPTLAPDELWRQLHTPTKGERKTHSGLLRLTTACKALHNPEFKADKRFSFFLFFCNQKPRIQRWVRACRNVYIYTQRDPFSHPKFNFNELK